MPEELTFKDEAAVEYDRAFAHVTAYFMPFLLRGAHLAPGMRVLDIATGTGLSAEAALAAVGPTGHVTAADISPAMARKARERLGKAPNVSVSVEDGHALSFSDESYAATLTATLNSTIGSYGQPEVDAKRKALKQFLRTSKVFDGGGVDFDAATLDDKTGETLPIMQPNSSIGGPGDKIHPNRASYAAMANAVDLDMITGRK